jgi:hypothetical protein
VPLPPVAALGYVASCRVRSGRCAPAALGYVAICRGRSVRCEPAALGYVAGGAVR